MLGLFLVTIAAIELFAVPLAARRRSPRRLAVRSTVRDNAV